MEGFGGKFIKAEQPAEEKKSPEISPEVEENISRIRLEAECLENASQEKEKETTLGKLRRTLAKETSVALVGLSALALFSAYPSEARAEEESALGKVKDVIMWFRHDDATMQKRISGLEAYESRKRAREQRTITNRENARRSNEQTRREIERVKEGYARQRGQLERYRMGPSPESREMRPATEAEKAYFEGASDAHRDFALGAKKMQPERMGDINYLAGYYKVWTAAEKAASESRDLK